MRIVNLMMAKGRGGLEQCFADYCEALSQLGIQTHAIAAPDCPYLPNLAGRDITIHRLTHHGPWDIAAAIRLNQMIHQIAPDAIICHGNRAITLTTSPMVRFITRMPCPVIGVAHNNRIKRFKRLDAAIAITKNMRNQLCAFGIDDAKIIQIPNMVRPTLLPKKHNQWHYPPIIGTIGRLHPNKGMDIWIAALSLLNDRGIDFRAKIAGDGSQCAKLKALARKLNIAHKIEWLGWVEDKTGFYNAIDIFCLPSKSEPFGIVLLEAMAHGLPVIATPTDGPCQILTHGKDGLLLTDSTAFAMADALEQSLAQPQETKKLGIHARHTIECTYLLETVGKRLAFELRKQITKATTS